MVLTLSISLVLAFLAILYLLFLVRKLLRDLRDVLSRLTKFSQDLKIFRRRVDGGNHGGH